MLSPFTMPYDTAAMPIISNQSFHITYLGITVFALLFSLTTLFAIYMEHQSSNTWYQVAEDEYNFMASAESEQSRIDLAEAYIDIGQHADAKIILQGLLSSKNPITKQKSKQLLSVINTA